MSRAEVDPQTARTSRARWPQTDEPRPDRELTPFTWMLGVRLLGIDWSSSGRDAAARQFEDGHPQDAGGLASAQPCVRPPAAESHAVRATADSPGRSVAAGQSPVPGPAPARHRTTRSPGAPGWSPSAPRGNPGPRRPWAGLPPRARRDRSRPGWRQLAQAQPAECHRVW
jgi:hypothetical protein